MKYFKRFNPVKVWKWSTVFLLILSGGFTLLGAILKDEWFMEWSLIFLVPMICLAFAPLILSILLDLIKRPDDQ